MAAAQKLLDSANQKLALDAQDDIKNAQDAAGVAGEKADQAKKSADKAEEQAEAAKKQADAASDDLKQVLTALKNGKPTVALQPPAAQDLYKAARAAQSDSQSAATSKNDAGKSADAAERSAECESVNNAKGLLKQTRQALASASNNAAPAVKLTVTEACDLQDVLNRLSLHTIRAVVGGEMSMDVDSIPGTIQNVDFDAEDTFAVKGTRTGTITGSFSLGHRFGLRLTQVRQSLQYLFQTDPPTPR